MTSSRLSLLESIKDSHTSSYLTLMSITQGVALGFMAFSVTQDFHKYNHVSYLLLVATFCVVIAVWHEYFVAVASLTWIPDLLDSFIPFSLLASQIALIYFINNTPDKWYLSMSVLCFIAFIAYLNMYIKSNRLEENRGILDVISYLKPFTLGLVIGLAILEFGFWYKKELVSPIFFPIITCLILLVFLIRGSVYWKRIVDHAKEEDIQQQTAAAD